MTDNTEPTEVSAATKQDGGVNTNHQEGGQFAPGNNANPEGKGGFGDNPENRSSGHWDKADRKIAREAAESRKPAAAYIKMDKQKHP